jgi:hypothetical protein
MLCMEVGRLVLLVEHPNDDAKERGHDGHARSIASTIRKAFARLRPFDTIACNPSARIGIAAQRSDMERPVKSARSSRTTESSIEGGRGGYRDG